MANYIKIRGCTGKAQASPSKFELSQRGHFKASILKKAFWQSFIQKNTDPALLISAIHLSTVRIEYLSSMIAL
jgi:hypothetical protein